MKGMMHIIPTTGPLVSEELTSTPDLSKIKAALNGGYLELIPRFNRWDSVPDPSWTVVAFCDEEGKLHDLPYNYAATALWQAQNGNKIEDHLVGPIVVITGDKELMHNL